MSKHLQIDNRNYVSSVAAGKSAGYSNDYLSRLCRAGTLDCRRIGRVWFIEEQSLSQYVARKGSNIQVTETSETNGRKPEIATKAKDFSTLHPSEVASTAHREPPPVAKVPTPRNTFAAKNFNAIQQEEGSLEPENSIHNSVATRESGFLVNEPISNEHVKPIESAEAQVPQQSQLPRELQHAQQTVSAYQPTKSPIQKKSVEQRTVAPAAHTTHSEAGTQKSQTSFGPIVGFLVAGIILSGGGYTYARVSDTPLHAVVRDNAATAKIGFEYALSKISKRERDSNNSYSEKEQDTVVVNPETAEHSAQKRVVRAPGAKELVSAIWDEMVQSSKEVFVTLTNLSDIVLTYGTKPTDALAGAFSSIAALNQETLRGEVGSLYTPIASEGSPEIEGIASIEPQVIEQTIVNQPVVERVVEQHFTVIESGVTLEQLQQTENELRKLFGEYASRDPVQPIENFRTIALSQRIDNLGSVDITNSTFAGGSISDSSAALTTLSTTGNVTIGGDLTVTGSTSLGSISDLTLTGDLAVNGGDITTTATTWNFDVADTGTIQFRDGTNTLFTITDQGSTGDVTISGDLTIAGDDITLGTNTSGFILVADGTNFNPVAVSGDVAIDSTGATTIQAGAVDLTTDVTGTLPVANGGTGATTLNDLITLGTHTTGNYLATLADAGNSFFTVTGSGSESAAVTLDIANDSLNFAQFSDTLALDASTDIAVDGTEVFSITNTGTGNSFLVRDTSSDTTPFVIDEDGFVGIGNSNPVASLNVTAPAATSGHDLVKLINGADGAEIIIDTGTNLVQFTTGAGDDLAFLPGSGGDVGIGVTDPDIRLEVFETVADAQLKLSYDATRYSQFQTDSAGDLIIDAQGGDVYLNDENLFVCTGGSCPAGTPASTGTIVAESRIGIGVSDPAAPLEFASNVQSGMDAYTDFQILLHDSGTAATSYGIGIESNTLAFNTDAEYDFYIDGAATPEVNINNATSTFQGDLVIAGKLDVDTIDPVYTISGVKYATYGHSTIGIKEEATAKLTLEHYDDERGLYYTVVDFDEVPRHSDLWLFYQVSSFGDNWERLLVNITPTFEGSVHYEENVGENKLTVYSDREGVVSARFIADRYDADEWPNLRADQGVGWPGHIIDEK